MPIQTDLNISPYFDDFDETKNFHKVLFRPGVAVQARELTQLQSILQNQIEEFGENVLVEGTVVKGCVFNFDNKIDYIKINDLQADGQTVSVSTYANQTLVSASSNLTATIVNQASGFESQSPDLNTLYIKYRNTGNGGQKKFANSESIQVLYANGASIANVTVANSSYSNNIGTGYSFKVSDGAIFQKGHFLSVAEQDIIVSKYTSNAHNISVGFQTIESIVNNSIDTTLLDNAQGFNNENAPGAFRLKLSPVLTIKTKAEKSSSNNFFSLVDFENGNSIHRNQNTSYNKLGQELASRTNDESGDYVVRPFSIQSEEISGNTTHSNILMSAGVAYVDGYKVELHDTARISLPKATTQIEKTNQIITPNFGNYIIVNEVLGSLDYTLGTQITLHTDAYLGITSNYSEAPSSLPNQIGTAKVRAVESHEGVPGTPNSTIRIYLFDISMTAGKQFSLVKSIHFTSTNDFVADMVLESNIAVLKDSGLSVSVHPLGSRGVSTLRNNLGVNNTSYIHRKVDNNVTFSTNGSLEIVLSGNNKFPFTNGSSLSSIQETELVVSALTGANTAAKSGNVTTHSNTTIDGSGTNFVTDYDIGDYISVVGEAQSRRIVEISNTTHLLVDSNFPSNQTNALHYRNFPKDTLIPLTSRSANVVISQNQQKMTINLDQALSSTIDASIIYPIKVDSAVQINKNLKEVYTKIDTSNNVNGTIGPWHLGVPDSLKLIAVYKGSTYANTETDVTKHFILDSGQKDAYYGISSLQLKPSSDLSISSSDKILVHFNAFQKDNSAGGSGFFSIDSYSPTDSGTLNNDQFRTGEIPLFNSPTNGDQYDLRDSVDFRPMTSNTGVYANTIVSASINPANTILFTSDKFIAPGREFDTDFKHYLPRVDLLHFESTGRINIIEGVASESPVKPSTPDTGMIIATIAVPVYPSLSISEAVALGRPSYGIKTSIKQIRRYTMANIGSMEERLARLEYYTSLNLLEKQTTDLIIKGSGGLDRFKNGILVDSFKDLSIGNINSLEFSAGIDKPATQLIPKVEQVNLDLKYNSGSSTNVTKTGDLITVNYSDRLIMNNPYASRSRSAAGLFYQYNGKVTLFPEYDNYYDSTVNPLKVNNITIDMSSGFESLIDELNKIDVINQRRIDVINDISRNTLIDSRTTSTNNGNWNTVETTNTFDVIRERTLRETRQLLNIADNNTSTVQVGEYMTDMAMQPYMRSRIVKFAAFGLRPSTRHYIYFDDISVDIHCRPAINTSSSSTITENDINEIGEFGGSIVSDASGAVYGSFRIPASTFFVGERILTIADESIATALSDATSIALKSFNAYNFSIEKGSSTISTRQPTFNRIGWSNTTIETTRDTQVQRTRRMDAIPQQDGGDNNGDPLAQTFYVGSSLTDNEEGIFINKVDLFFHEKDNVEGVTIEMRSVVNGAPSNIILPFGQKHILASDVNISNNGATATTVTWDSPLFVRQGSEYAVIIKPDGNNPAYKLWVSRTGELDIATGIGNITQDNFDGVLFQSTNDRTWTARQDENLKLNIYAADFSTTAGQAIFNNPDIEFLNIGSVSGSFLIGENVYKQSANVSAQTVSMSAISSNLVGTGTTFTTSFAIGDRIVVTGEDSNNTVRSQVLTISSIANNTQLAIKGQPLFSNSIANYQITPSGVVSYYNNSDAVLHIDNSNVSNSNFVFANNDTIIAADSNANAVITSLYNHTVSYFQPLMYRLNFGGNMTSSGITTLTAKDSISNTTSVAMKFNDNNRIITFEPAVYSRSNEILNNSGNKTLTTTINLSTGKGELTPALDVQSSSLLAFESKINANTTNEAYANGASQSKYVSRTVTLKEGLDAEDFKIFVSAYRPSGTDVSVYIKGLNSSDNSDFNDKKWTLLNNLGNTVFSSTANEFDVIEYEYDLPNTPNTTPLVGVLSTSNATSTISVSGNTPGFSNGSANIISSGSLLKIVNSNSDTDYQIVRVSSVNTSIIVVDENINFTKSGASAQILNSDHGLFKDPQNNLVATYFDINGVKYDEYKTFAVKLVLSSNSSNIIPKINDYRALALSV
jgi:hypothetical protein